MTSHKLLNDFVFVLHLLFICLFVSSSSVQASFVLGELGDWGSCIFFTHTPRSPMMPCITPLQLAGPPTPPPPASTCTRLSFVCYNTTWTQTWLNSKLSPLVFVKKSVDRSVPFFTPLSLQCLCYCHGRWQCLKFLNNSELSSWKPLVMPVLVTSLLAQSFTQFKMCLDRMTVCGHPDETVCS